MDNHRESTISPRLSTIFAYVLKYLAYGFLTYSVLSTFTATMIIYTTIWGSDIPFLQHLSFIIPIDIEGNASLDADDIMRAFSFLTLIFLVIIEVSKAIKGKVVPSSKEPDQEIRNPLLRGMMPTFIIITLIFVITALVLPFSDLAEGTSLFAMYGVVTLFYVMAVVSGVIYTVINNKAESNL